MGPALDPAGHRVPRTKPTCLLHTWRPHRRRPFPLVLHLHQHQSSRNLHLQYLAKNQSTQRCQSLFTQGSDHPPVLEPHMVLTRRRPWRPACSSEALHVTKLRPGRLQNRSHLPNVMDIKCMQMDVGWVGGWVDAKNFLARHIRRAHN
jgi:hypothetical protein